MGTGLVTYDVTETVTNLGTKILKKVDFRLVNLKRRKINVLSSIISP